MSIADSFMYSMKINTGIQQPTFELPIHGRTVCPVLHWQMAPVAVISLPPPHPPTAHDRPFDVTGPYVPDVRKARAMPAITVESVTATPTVSTEPRITRPVYDRTVSRATKLVHVVH